MGVVYLSGGKFEEFCLTGRTQVFNVFLLCLLFDSEISIVGARKLTDKQLGALNSRQIGTYSYPKTISYKHAY